MRSIRLRKLRSRIASLCGAGILLQSVQCTAAEDPLLRELIQSISAVFISDYVNSLFGVQGGSFF